MTKPTELDLRLVFERPHSLKELSLGAICELEYTWGATDKIPQAAIDFAWFKLQLATVGVEVRGAIEA